MSNFISNNIVKIKSIGGSLNLDFTASLTEKQINELGINFKSISTIKDLQPYIIPRQQNNNNTDEIQLSNNNNNSSLYPFISITSSNSLINSLLFINKANKTKCFVEYIIPFSCFYPEDLQFLKEFVEHITAKNLLLIEEHNLLDISPHITFTLKKINADNDEIIESKHFIICDKNNYDKDNNTYCGDLYSGLNYGYECSYFYSSVKELYSCKLDSYDEILSFLTHVSDAFPNTKICINYANFFSNKNDSEMDMEMISSIGDLLKLTDVYIFEQNEVSEYFSFLKSINENDNTETKTYKSINSKRSNSKYSNMYKNNKKTNVEDIFIEEISSIKKNKTIKIGLFINEMKTITIIQQDPSSKLIMFHSKFDIDFLPSFINDKDKKEYTTLLSKQYDIIKSVFIGGFLSRFFNNKSFQTCYTAGNESVKRIIDILRFNLDFPIESNYYIITIKKPRQKSKENSINFQKESHFVLDCTNKIASQKKEYNSLYDHMCESYFSNANTQKHLYKLGFITKKGIILNDPDKKFFGSVRNKLLMSNYEKEKTELMKRKENNEIMKLQLRNITKNKSDEYKDKNVNELMGMSAVFNFEKTAYRKLPSVIINRKDKKKCRKTMDLYYQEIKHSRFLGKNRSDKRNNSNSLTKYSNIKSRYLQKNASCDDIKNHEYVYYEKESIESNKYDESNKEERKKSRDVKKNKKEVEEYINKDKFLNLLNTYEQKLRGDSFLNELK